MNTDRLQKEVEELQKEVEQLKDALSDAWPSCELTRAAQDYYRAVKEGSDNHVVMVALESQLQRALEGNCA